VVGSAQRPRGRERASERAEGQNCALCLGACTERYTNPGRQNHSEHLARGGCDGGLLELKSGIGSERSACTVSRAGPRTRFTWWTRKASILAIALDLKRPMAASFFRTDCVFTQFVLQRLQKERACTSGSAIPFSGARSIAPARGIVTFICCCSPCDRSLYCVMQTRADL
jgi:hypothetical protein